MNYSKENKPQSTQRAQRKQGRFLHSNQLIVTELVRTLQDEFAVSAYKSDAKHDLNYIFLLLAAALT